MRAEKESKALRILNLEDDPLDTELIQATLLESGLNCEVTQVQTRADFAAALEKGYFDLILSDYTLPSFDGLSALEMAQKVCPEDPFIIVSGTLGEEAAIESMKSGATDYVLKHRLERLVPAVRRAVHEAEVRSERRRAEEALRESEERFRALVQNASDIITVIDADGTVRYVSPAIERVLGYRPEEMIGNSAFDFLHPEDLEEARGIFAEILSEPGIHPPLEFRVAHKDGSWRYFEHAVNNLLDDPSVRGIVVNQHDVTERRRIEEALRQAEEKYRGIFENAIEGIFQTATDGRILTANPAMARIYGYESREELMEVTSDAGPQLYADPDHWTEFARLMRQRGSVSDFEALAYRKDGSLIWVSVNARAMRDVDGEIVAYEGTVEDVTARKELEEQLEHQAFHDALTGLPNRPLFLDRLRQALARAERRENSVAVLFMDLDGFKRINDSLGHEVGDRLLVAVAGRLGAGVRLADTVARFGGDEFVILLEDIASAGEAIRAAERIAEELRAPFVLAGEEVTVTTSVGIALNATGRDRPEDLLRDADSAMYEAKKKGKARYEVFDPSMNERAVARLRLENDLRRALERDEFAVHYQPEVSLESGEVIGAEALVRWKHPARGLVYPEEFVPLAEETGLIVPIGWRVLREACRQARRWQDQRASASLPKMSVNLSARQLTHPGLVEDVAGVLRASRLEARDLILEVTESGLMGDVETSVAILRRLKDLGVRIAVDDFGKGYSSLYYLKCLPIDILKADRSFVGGLGTDGKDEGIVRVVIELAHTLGLEVVAEGVESGEQLEHLREVGCDLAQGFYFWRPVPTERAGELLATYNYP